MTILGPSYVPMAHFASSIIYTTLSLLRYTHSLALSCQVMGLISVLEAYFQQSCWTVLFLSNTTIARQMSMLNWLYFKNNMPVPHTKTIHCTHTHTHIYSHTRHSPIPWVGLVVWWLAHPTLSSQEKKKEEMCLVLSSVCRTIDGHCY